MWTLRKENRRDKVSFRVGILLYSDAKSFFFSRRTPDGCEWDKWRTWLIRDIVFWQMTNHTVFFLLILQNRDAEFSDVFWGATENNRFVTVALLLISVWEEAEEEIFWRAEGAENEETQRFHRGCIAFSTYVDDT